MPTSREAAAAAAATAATDALAGQAAVAAHQAILARQAAATAAQRAEFAYLAGLAPNRRSVAQNNRLAVFLATALRTQHAGPTALHALSSAVQVVEMARGTTIYRLNDPADSFYVVVDGRVVLYDVKDKEEAEEDDGVVDHLSRGDSFGEEDLLTGCRRAHRADVVPEVPAILLRVPLELYRKYLQHLHAPDFEDKVAFLAQLEVFRSLPEDTLRKLAPCFTQVELHAKDYLVRQGERAESMYAIASGECSVLVDPNFRPDAPPGSTQVPEVDPKKAMQVCHIGPGNIVGDMTVLANVRRRTASILALSDLVAYKIRRATFIRRVPAIQLEALRQVAEAKLRITERRLHSATTGPGGTAVGMGGRRSSTGQPVLLTLRDKILHGHDLRQLSHQPSNAVGPLELRGVRRGSVNGNVEMLLANTLAAAAAAAAAAAPQGAAGAMASMSAPNMGIVAGPSYGGWTGGAPAEARMRFGRGARKSISIHSMGADGAGGGGGGGWGPDRAGAGRRRVTSSSTMISGSTPRYQDINFSWGLGPGTLINSLLERPATAVNRRSQSSAEAIRNLTQSLSTPATMPRGGAPTPTPILFAPPNPPPPPLSIGTSDPGLAAPTTTTVTITPTSAAATTAPATTAGPVAGSPQSLPSQASLFAALSATARQHPPVHYTSVGYGRGATPAALRAASAKVAASVPRWGFSPTDGYGPYGGGSGISPFLSYSAAAAAAASGIDASGFSVVGISVGGGNGGGSSSGARPPGAGGGASGAPASFGERLSTALFDHSARGSQSTAQLRPGPILGAPAGPASHPALQQDHQQPQPQQPQRPLSLSQPPSPSQLQDVDQVLQQVPMSLSQAPQHLHPDLRPPQPSDGGEGARGPLTVDIPANRLAAVGPVVVVQMVDSGPESRGFPSQPPTTEPTTPHPHSHLTAGYAHGYGSPSNSLAWETETPNSPAGDGSGEDGGGWGRHTPRKQKSMGKARFGRRLVTQNSSVDAMVAEAIVQVYAQDVMIRQALAAEAALAVVEGEAAQSAEAAAQMAALQEVAREHEVQGGGNEGGADDGLAQQQVPAAEAGVGGEEGAEESVARGAEPSGLTPETSAGDDGEERAAQEREEALGGESAGHQIEGQASGAVAEEGTAEGQQVSPRAVEDNGSKTKAVEGDDGDGEGVAATAAEAEETATNRLAGSESSPMASPRPPPPEAAAEPEAKVPDTPDVAATTTVNNETPPAHPNEGGTPDGGDAEPSAAAMVDGGARRPSGAGSLGGAALGTERSHASVGSAASDASAGPRSQPPEAAAESPRSGEVPGPNPLAEPSVSRRASRDSGAGGPPRGSLSGDQDIIGLTPLLRRLSSTSMSITGRSVGPGVVAPRAAGAAAGGAGAEGGQSLPAGSGEAGEGAAIGATGITPRGALGASPRGATIVHGSQPARLLSQGRHPFTVQLVLPDAGSVSFGRQGGMSPPRRLLSMPTGPRPYPYVGPFLSSNKGLPLPPALTSSMSGMNQMGIMVTKQISSSSLAERAGITSDRSSAGEMQSMRTVRAQGHGYGLEGHGGVFGGGGGGGAAAAGLASGNPLHGAKGQLKRGGALYRSANTVPRNGATPHV